jgi:ATP synthase protein I
MTTDRVTPLLVGALKPTLVIAALAVVTNAALFGGRGFLGAVLGAVVVVVFSGGGLLALRAMRSAPPASLLLVALGSFILRVIFFGLVLQVANSVDGLDAVIHRGATAGTIIACVVAWMVAEIWVFSRLRIPTYDLGAAASEATGGSSQVATPAAEAVDSQGSAPSERSG